jgi:hypothetical protein
MLACSPFPATSDHYIKQYASGVLQLERTAVVAKLAINGGE